jgi:hypothetical protein
MKMFFGLGPVGKFDFLVADSLPTCEIITFLNVACFRFYELYYEFQAISTDSLCLHWWSLHHMLIIPPHFTSFWTGSVNVDLDNARIRGK